MEKTATKPMLRAIPQSADGIQGRQSPLKGIELVPYFRTTADSFSTVTPDKVREEFKTPGALYNEAEKNTFTAEDFVVRLLEDILEENEESYQKVGLELFAVTNPEMHCGFVQVLNEKEMTRFMDTMGYASLWVFPSSIHEAIVMPRRASDNVKELCGIVQSVNGKAVLPEGRLANRVYSCRRTPKGIKWEA